MFWRAAYKLNIVYHWLMRSKIRLTRATGVIPENELWLHTPRNRKLLARAITWAENNPPKMTDLDALERKLKRQR